MLARTRTAAPPHRSTLPILNARFVARSQSAYAASKGAVYAMTHSWAKELGDRGVRVVGVSPGVLEATGLRTPEYEHALVRI